METLYIFIYIYIFIYVYTDQCASWNLTIRFRIKIVQCSYLMLATVHRSFFSLLSIWVRNKPQAAIVSLCFKPSFPPLWLCQQLRRKHGFVESFCQRVLTFLLLKILDKEVSNGSDFGLLTLLECHDNPVVTGGCGSQFFFDIHHQEPTKKGETTRNWYDLNSSIVIIINALLILSLS